MVVGVTGQSLALPYYFFIGCFFLGCGEPATLNIGFEPISKKIDFGSRSARLSPESNPSNRSILPYGSDAGVNSMVYIPNLLSVSFRAEAARFTLPSAELFTVIRFPPYDVPPPEPQSRHTSYPVIQAAPLDPSPGALPMKFKSSCPSRYASGSGSVPQVSTVIGWPVNGLSASSKDDFPSSNNCQRGVCSLTCARRDTSRSDRSCALFSTVLTSPIASWALSAASLAVCPRSPVSFPFVASSSVSILDCWNSIPSSPMTPIVTNAPAKIVTSADRTLHHSNGMRLTVYAHSNPASRMKSLRYSRTNPMATRAVQPYNQILKCSDCRKRPVEPVLI